MKEEPPPDAKCRDKFLVQTIPITPERDIANVAAIVFSQCALWLDFAYILQWQNVEKTSKGDIQERKIRVLFLPAEGSLATPSHNVVNGTVSLRLLSTIIRSLNDILASRRRRSSCI